MLRRRFAPKLTAKDEAILDGGNSLTILRLDALMPYVEEFRNQVKPLIPSDEKMIGLVVDALVLFYKWNKDFLDHDLNGLPKADDLNSTEELSARETTVEFIVKAMEEVDKFHPEFRTLCLNVHSLSVVNIRKQIVLFSFNIHNGTIH